MPVLAVQPLRQEPNMALDFYGAYRGLYTTSEDLFNGIASQHSPAKLSSNSDDSSDSPNISAADLLNLTPSDVNYQSDPTKTTNPSMDSSDTSSVLAKAGLRSAADMYKNRQAKNIDTMRNLYYLDRNEMPINRPDPQIRNGRANESVDPNQMISQWMDRLSTFVKTKREQTP